jgi:hypothetical protein
MGKSKSAYFLAGCALSAALLTGCGLLFHDGEGGSRPSSYQPDSYSRAPEYRWPYKGQYRHERACPPYNASPVKRHAAPGRDMSPVKRK